MHPVHQWSGHRVALKRSVAYAGSGAQAAQFIVPDQLAFLFSSLSSVRAFAALGL